jgi:hypothetical protein
MNLRVFFHLECHYTTQCIDTIVSCIKLRGEGFSIIEIIVKDGSPMGKDIFLL